MPKLGIHTLCFLGTAVNEIDLDSDRSSRDASKAVALGSSAYKKAEAAHV